MNSLYADLENKFPNEVDDFDKFQDPSLPMLDAINQYKTFYNAGQFDAAINVLNQNPDLRRCILNAENMNKLRDAIISVERFYLDDVQKYLMEIVEWKGMYSPTESYEKYNVVEYVRKGMTETFMAVKPVPPNTLPTVQEYWVAITLRGEQGASGTGLAGRGDWMTGTQYQKDDWVAYNDTIWAASQDNIDSVPYDDSPDWYAVIRDQRHYVWSSIEPTTQYRGDVWYHVQDDGSVIQKVKMADGSYKPFSTHTSAKCVKFEDGTNIQDRFGKLSMIDNITLQKSKWQPSVKFENLYYQEITEPWVLDKMVPDKTIIDCSMDLSVRRAVEESGTRSIWFENQNGTPIAYLDGELSPSDLVVQIRILNL